MITGITVGFDYFHGVPELRIKSVEIISPAGWEGKLVFTEESPEFEVKWTSANPTSDIQRGISIGGFGIRIDKNQDDVLFRQTHFTTIFGDSTIASDVIKTDPIH